jgi:hypothetical protein
VQHRRQGEPVLQLSSRPAGDNSKPHRQFGGGGSTSGEPYTELRRRLLAARQLTDIQRVEQLFNLPPLAALKPSELLAEMLRLCHRGQENNALFNCLFLNKLPRELRILLSEADKQALGARVDLFATHNSEQDHDVVAAVAAAPLLEPEGEDTTVAAVRPGTGRGQRCSGGDSVAAAGGARRSLDTVAAVAADSRCPTRCCTPGQAGNWVVLQPLLLWSQGQVMQGSLHLVGKLGSPGQLKAIAAGQLIHMLDQISNRVSLWTPVLPTASFHTALLCLPRDPSCLARRVSLFIAGETAWCSFDSRIRIFSWKFLLADVAFPILGVDFFRAHKLLIDPEGHALLDSTGRRFAGQLLRSPPMAAVVIGFVQPYKPMVESSSSAHNA